MEPAGPFSGQSADERRRFLAGAERRGEMALVVSLIGNTDDDHPRSPLSSYSASIPVGGGILPRSVTGRRLPTGPLLELASELGPADRDLALRLRNRPPTAPWWALELRDMSAEWVGPAGVTRLMSRGRLEPILVNNLGEPVAGAWVPPDGRQRWYVLPDGIDWNTVLDWLMQHALPQFAPTALRRARSPRFADPDLQTRDELVARQELADLEAHYAEEKLRLKQQLLAAQAQAEPLRHGLLYGSGTPLVNAVHAVLTAAGMHVVDLDLELGATKSADLLVSLDDTGPWRLVEIKSAGGRPSENLVVDLQRHLNTWPQLRPERPVAGGVLIVNHQHKLDPSERDIEVYTRQEFVDTLQITVLSTRHLFDWWRLSDWAAIRTAVLGRDITPATPAATTPTDPSVPAGAKSRWWQRRT
ncbi:hypothetical protein KBI5_14765 [Frankia sp. KB5]|nr:hypothetical protein KBI5_14765 [Frankia sp. KB5]